MIQFENQKSIENLKRCFFLLKICTFKKKAHFKLKLANIPSKNISSPESITFLRKSFTFYNLNSKLVMLVIRFHSLVQVYFLMPLKGSLFNNCYNVAGKVMQFQSSNLLTSSTCSIIIWMHADGKTKPLKCLSVSFQWVWRNSNLIVSML